MKRKPTNLINPAQGLRKHKHLLVELLEDRCTPATFSFAGFTFEQNSTPDVQELLAVGTYQDAVVDSVPISATGTVAFPEPPAVGFDSSLTLGNIFVNTGTVRAINLPNGNDGTAKRSGVELSWSGSLGVPNKAGDDLVFYESASDSTTPEGFMVQVRNAGTGAWSSWYYESADSFAFYSGGPFGAFATAFDLTDFGFTATDVADGIRIVNMIDTDRLVDPSGEGKVLPEDDGATSTFLPNPGPLASFPNYGSTTFDPDPIYVGVFNALVAPSVPAQVDLQITKTDGLVTVNAGNTVTYTIVASNSGPDVATGASVVDTFPSTLTNVTWSSTASGGATGNTAASSGKINDIVNFPSGSSVTYIVTGTVSPAATGQLSNTTTVTAANGTNDTNLANNTATDTTTIISQADLVVTKSDGQLEAVPGTLVTYSIVVRNNSTNPVNGATLTDAFPANLVGVSYSSTVAGGATGNTVAGSGNLTETLNLPADASVTYVVTGTIRASATGTISNSATATPPAGSFDPTPDNATATDVNTLTPRVDLIVTNTDGVTEAIPGTALTYTIVVSNTGPSDAVGATLTDLFPSNLVGVTYSSTVAGGATGNTVAGSGNLAETLNLPVGSSVTYVVRGTIRASATGTISNTATATPATGSIDPTPGNATATDVSTLTPQVDLAVISTDGVTEVVPGTALTYTIVVSNTGPSDAVGATLTDLFPANLVGVTYSSTVAGGATGNTVAGSGNLAETLNLPVGSSVTYVVTGTVLSSATGTLRNTAIALPAFGSFDPTPGNATAIDENTLTPVADLSITKTDGLTTVAPGGALTYTIVVTNAGPSDVSGATVTDAFPSVLNTISWTVTSSTGIVRTGSGNIADTIDLPAGTFATYTVTTTVNPTATDSFIVNTSTIAAPSGVVDPNTSNNSATDNDTRIQLVPVIPRPIVDQNLVSGFAISPGLSGIGSITVYNGDGTVNYTIPTDSANFGSDPRVAVADVNGDGVLDLLIGSGIGVPALVEVLSGVDRSLLFSLSPFEVFTGGVFVASADFDGDGTSDIVVTPDHGGGPRARIYSGRNAFGIADFFAIEDDNFRGGIRPAVGDINNDGVADLVVSAGFGGGPRVAGYSGAALGTGITMKLFSDFYIFENTLRNGAYVALGDLDGDGFAEIIGGGGPGGGPRIYALSGRELTQNRQFVQVANFFAGDVNARDGVRIAVHDVDSDGIADLLAAVREDGRPGVSVYTGESTPIMGNPPVDFLLDSFESSFGVFVG